MTKNSPVISIVVPVFNVEKYLSHCLDSIIGQSYNNLEIICVNDGSTDNSADILDLYAAKDYRIKIITQKNAGLSVARNTALDYATGEYISFIDSDDWIAPDFYEILINEALASDAQVVQCGYHKISEEHDKIKLFSAGCWQNYTEILSNLDKCYVWNKIWRADILKKYQLRFEPHLYYEDILFTAKAAKHITNWVLIDYAGYFYRYNPASITHAPDKEKKRSDDRYKINSLVLSEYAQDANKNIVKKFMLRHLIDVNELSNNLIYKKYSELFGKNQKLIQKRYKALFRHFLACLFRKH